MLGVQEVRPGRFLYVETLYGDPGGQAADTRQVAILVHGSMAHCSQFDEQCKALLRAGISVVRYDILGCGRSARPRASAYGRRLVTYSPDEAYKDLQAILQQACSQDSGAWESVILIGHSYGVPFCLQLAAEQPKRISGVICLGFGYPRPGTVPPTIFDTWYVKCPELMLQLLMPVLATSRIRKLYYKDTPHKNPKLIRSEWLAWVRNSPWVVQALMVQIPDQTAPWSKFRALVQSISAPTLIIDQESSEQPGQTPPELMAADMQDAEGVAVPQAGHQVHQDQPQAVNSLILDFLQSRVCHLTAVKPC